MKPIFNSISDLAKYFDFIPMSKADENRLEIAWNMYNDDYKADGVMGCCAEVLTATKGSKKSTVSNAGQFDCCVMYRSESGAVIPVYAERKTNGGRIKTLETEYSRSEEIHGKYVIYSLDICNANTSYLRRTVKAVVIPRSLFLAKLEEFNAIKTVNVKHKLSGYAIQSSSKKWFTWLSDYPIVYDRNAVYCDDDFDGLT